MIVGEESRESIEMSEILCYTIFLCLLVKEESEARKKRRKKPLQTYFRLRKEFLEYRHTYQTILATRNNYTVEELSDIEHK